MWWLSASSSTRSLCWRCLTIALTASALSQSGARAFPFFCCRILKYSSGYSKRLKKPQASVVVRAHWCAPPRPFFGVAGRASSLGNMAISIYLVPSWGLTSPESKPTSNRPRYCHDDNKTNILPAEELILEIDAAPMPTCTIDLRRFMTRTKASIPSTSKQEAR